MATIEYQNRSHGEAEFIIRGITRPQANRLRQILLNYTPTMAFDKIFIFINTSPLKDDILSHRLFFVPLDVGTDIDQIGDSDTESTSDNTLVFQLAAQNTTGTVKTIYSRDLVWVPQGNQLERFAQRPKPAIDNIIITKLEPGQQIDLELHAIKGYGSENPKWSPVSLATFVPIQNEEEPWLKEEWYQFTVETIGSIDIDIVLEKAFDLFEIETGIRI